VSGETDNPAKAPEQELMSAKIELPTGIMHDFEFTPETTVKTLYDEITAFLSIESWILLSVTTGENYREIYPGHGPDMPGEITVKSVVDSPGFQYFLISYLVLAG
jgi:hypothetical protein